MKATTLFRSPGLTALVLIVMILALQYGGAHYVKELVRTEAETTLTKRTDELGNLFRTFNRTGTVQSVRDILDLMALQDEMMAEGFELAQSIDPNRDEAFDLEALIQTNPVDRTLRVEFDEFSEELSIDDVVLLDLQWRVLLSTAGSHNFRDPYEYARLESPLIEKAIQTERAQSTVVIQEGTGFVKRTYVPVFDLDRSEPLAVLSLTLGEYYTGQLSGLIQDMRVYLIVVTGMAFVIGLLVYQLMARQRKIEQQIAHADRLSSLGTLAAGFAHEVRNPLEIIGACTQDLEQTLGSSSLGGSGELVESCQDILEEVDRLNRLVGQFLTYSRIDNAPVAHEKVSIAESLKATAALLRHVTGKANIQMVIEPPKDEQEYWVGIAESSLRQIVINLIMNSIQAMPDGGKIKIKSQADIKTVKLLFHDDGPGISPSAASKIFDPFHTTRETGSGLGLAIAHQLASRAGGNLEYVSDKKSRGAKFVLTLPRAKIDQMVRQKVAQPIG